MARRWTSAAARSEVDRRGVASRVIKVNAEIKLKARLEKLVPWERSANSTHRAARRVSLCTSLPGLVHT